MLFRVSDIETVPDLSIWRPNGPRWSPRPGEDGQARGRLLRNHEVGAKAWFEEVSGDYTTSVLSDLVYVKEEPFPPPHAHRVVAISWADVELVLGEDSAPFKFYKLINTHARASWSRPDSEVMLLREYRQVMVDRPATIVTWNGRTFDLPVLAMRALHHGVPWGWYYDSRDIRYRYSAEGHVDLMDFLSDYGASRASKLGDVARLVGLPGKTDMDGSMVAGIVAKDPSGSEEASVSRYCLQDVLQTALLFVRSRFHLEVVTLLDYARSIETFKVAARGVVDVEWDRFSCLGGAGA